MRNPPFTTTNTTYKGKIMDNPKYSVALCTYNGAKYIERQLKSIICQTVKPGEIIISDDGSTDPTLEIAENCLKNSGISYELVQNKNSQGVAGNFQHAISLCKYDYIFTADQDDVWVDTKAEIILNIFKANPKALLIFSDGELVNGNLHPLGCNMWKSVGISDRMLQENDWFSYLLNRCFVTGAAMAFKRVLFERNEKIPVSWLHDGWLSWKAAAQKALVPCSEKLLLYRQHGNNVVGMESVTSLGRIRKYVNNFKKMKKEHTVRYERYVALKNYMSDKFTPQQIHQLDECITFWHDLTKADNTSSKTEKIKIILTHWKNEDFKKYSNGNKGAFRELCLALFNFDAF